MPSCTVSKNDLEYFSCKGSSQNFAMKQTWVIFYSPENQRCFDDSRGDRMHRKELSLENEELFKWNKAFFIVFEGLSFGEKI